MVAAAASILGSPQQPQSRPICPHPPRQVSAKGVQRCGPLSSKSAPRISPTNSNLTSPSNSNLTSPSISNRTQKPGPLCPAVPGPAAGAMGAQTDLPSLLSKAFQNPDQVTTDGGGAYVALACHCLMVQHGFRVVDQPGARRRSIYSVPRGWQVEPDQWVVQYVGEGRKNPFTMHCSLHAPTGRMLIHATEMDNIDNTCLLGLQLENYTPGPAGKGKSWGDAISNQVQLVDFVKTNISTPLMAKAVVAQDGEQPLLEQPASWQGMWAVGAVAVALAVTAVLIYRKGGLSGWTF